MLNWVPDCLRTDIHRQTRGALSEHTRKTDPGSLCRQSHQLTAKENLNYSYE